MVAKIKRGGSIPRGSRRSIRAAKQRTIHKKIWRSSATVISHSSKEGVPDALERPALRSCSTNSSKSSIERQPTSDATSQGSVGERITGSAPKRSCCVEATPGSVVTHQSASNTMNQGGEVERVASARISCSMDGEPAAVTQQKLEPAESYLIQSDKRVPEDAIEVDVPARPNVGSSSGAARQDRSNPRGSVVCNGHHMSYDTRGISAARRRHSTGAYSRSVETISLRQATYGVHPMPAVDNDSRGLVGSEFGRSTAIVTTAKPLSVTWAAECVQASGSCVGVDAPLSCVEKTDHIAVKPATPSRCKSETSCSGDQESAVMLERQSERRELDALSSLPSVSSATKGNQCAGGVPTEGAAPTSDALMFKTSRIPQEASLSPAYPSMDSVVTEENGTTLPVQHDISRVDTGDISGATKQSLGKENIHGSSEFEVGGAMAIEALQALRPSSEMAFHNDVDVCKAKPDVSLGERSSIEGLCYTTGGAHVVTARCSRREDKGATRELPVLRRSTRRRSMRLVRRDVDTAVMHSRRSRSSYDNAGVSTTVEQEPYGNSNKRSIVGKVEAVEGMVTLETPEKVDPSSSTAVELVEKHVTETPYSPSEKAVTSERGAPEPQPASIRCTPGDDGARGNKCLATPVSSGDQDNDSTQQVRVLRRSQRRRSMGFASKGILRRNPSSVDVDQESVKGKASNNPAISQGMRCPPESETIWRSSTLQVASASPGEIFDDVSSEVPSTTRRAIVGHRATARDDTLSVACYPPLSPSSAAFRQKPAVRRSTRRRSLGAASRGDGVGLLRRARGAQYTETDVSESQGVTASMKNAARCRSGEDHMVRQEHTSVQGALTLVDKAPGASSRPSQTRSARLESSTNEPSSSLRMSCGLDDSPATKKRAATLGPGCLAKGRQLGAISAVVKECMPKAAEVGVEASIEKKGELQPLASLLAAIEAAEACCIKHELLSAGIGEERTSQTSAAGKRVRFCSFDLSTVDMPRDATDGSEAPAKEIARCLARVTDAQSVVHEALRASGSENKECVERWKAFLRELRAVGPCCVQNSSQGTIEQSKMEMQGAARFLLGELEPLETSEEPVYTALREKLGNVLASLVRFKLRILLNPPPEKLSKSDADVSDKTRFPGRSARLAGPTHFSKVHEMVELCRGQPNAAFARALRRLYGYPNERAVEFVAEAERFLATEASRGKKFDQVTLVEEARRHVIILADIVDAIRAQRFVRSLLNSNGVREAINAAGGWGDVEKLASDLKRLEGPADIHTPFTLLSDIEGFERWLDDESLWPVRAEGVLEQLLAFLAPVTEKPKKRRMATDESVELLREDALEARQRSQFPAVKATKKNIPNSLVKAERDRSSNADCRTLTNKLGGANLRTGIEQEAIIAAELVKVNGVSSGSRLSRSTSSKKKNRRNSIF